MTLYILAFLIGVLVGGSSVAFITLDELMEINCDCDLCGARSHFTREHKMWNHPSTLGG